EAELYATAANEIASYLDETHAALGAVPTQETLVLERFFDESGGMQLVLHAPFGSRINKAWGLALRKRFCRQFNFELQAAATEDALLLSLGPQHSFPLAGDLRLLSRDTPEPSPIAHEILNARPYAFLDDAPLEERRTQAVYARRATEPSSSNDIGALDREAIARVRDEARPDPRDAHELH